MRIRGKRGDGAVTVQFDADIAEPGLAIAEAVAEIEGREPTDLAAIYGCIDHVVDHIYSDPPAPEANVEVSFDYEGYRVTVRQDGEATFEPLSE